MAPTSLYKLRPLAAAIGLLLAFPSQAVPVNWAGTTGFWDVSGNWNPGLPTAIDDVTINVPDVQTVTVSSGNNTVNSIAVTGDATLALTGGTLSINGSSNLTNFTQSGGTLSGTGTVNISGPANWTGGTMDGSGNTIANAGLIISGGENHFLTGGRTLESNGTAIWSNALAYHYNNNGYYYTTQGPIYAGGGAAITNNGTWLDQNSLDNQIINNGGFQSNFNNNGVYTKSGNSTTSIGIGFNNASTGVVNVDAGNLMLTSSFTNQGAITVASGATVDVQNATFINQGALQGNGTYHTLNATTALVNSGTLAPGVGNIGALTISGDYTQTTTGIFDIQLASLTSYDKLTVLGDMNLSGTLRIHDFGGYNPNLGNTFTIATFDDGVADISDLTGIFSNIVWSGFNPGVSFTASYFNHSIVLNATTAPVPVPAAAWLFGTGLLGLFGSKRRKRVNS